MKEFIKQIATLDQEPVGGSYFKIAILQTPLRVERGEYGQKLLCNSRHFVQCESRRN